MDINPLLVEEKYLQTHGQTEEVTLICIGWLEYDWNFKVALSIQGTRYLHRKCPQESMGDLRLPPCTEGPSLRKSSPY
jgi:hypothetical protein